MATTQNFDYPSSSNVVVSGIGTPNGQPIPSSSVLIAGENPSGNQQVIQTDANGDLLVSPLTTASTVTVVQPTGTNLHAVIDSSALPTGASTSALQTTGNTSLATIATNTTGVATAANQTTGNTSLSSILTNQTNGTQITQLAAGSSIIGKIDIDQTTPGTTNGVVVNSSALPTGASTSALQTTGNTSLSTIATNTTGIATAANQATGNTSLSTIATNSALQATAANQTNGSQKTQLSTPTALTITQAAITVGTTAVRLTPSGSAPASTRVSLVATPDAASTGKFYIGSSTVTSTGTTRGIQIVAGQTFIANNDAGDYWIISDTASQTVEVLSQG